MRNRKLRVGLVEDQPLYRLMLGPLIHSRPEFDVVASASGYLDAQRSLDPSQLDAVILDVELGDGNGFALGRQFRSENANLGVLLLSGHDVMNLVLSIPRAELRGWGYLSKSSGLSPALLFRALLETAAGGTILDPELVKKSVPRRGSAIERLSERQFEVLQLVAQGYSNQSIAEQLWLSSRSVEGHLRQAYEVLGLSNNGDINPRVAAVLRLLGETSRTPS